MPQISHGIRSILEKGPAYNFFQWAIGGSKERKRYIQEFVRPDQNALLLDIGCGPGTMMSYLPESIRYYGIDISQEYVDFAKKKHGEKGVFICNDINNNDFLMKLPQFDVVIAHGLLHHLNDTEVIDLLGMAKKTMNKTGRLITLDNCYVDNQSGIAKFLIKNDRGQNVRTADRYEALAKTTFNNIKTTVLHDMLWIPYTHIIMECS